MKKYVVPHYGGIVMIGSGGTGGYIIPDLVRMISHLADVNSRPEITIVDPDIVELKNCNRQNFIINDIGKPKAEVHAVRYSAAFGIPVMFNIDRVSFDNMRQLVDRRDDKILIIDAVDSVRARRQIWKYVRGGQRLDWLSMGNTDKNGQAVLYSKGMFGDEARSVITVFPDEFSEEVERAETARNRNCADNAVSQPQSISINKTAANVATNILYQLLYDKEIYHDIVLFDRFNNTRCVAVGQSMIEEVSKEKSDKLAALLGGTNTTVEPVRASSIRASTITAADFVIGTPYPYRPLMDDHRQHVDTPETRANIYANRQAAYRAMMHDPNRDRFNFIPWEPDTLGNTGLTLEQIRSIGTPFPFNGMNPADAAMLDNTNMLRPRNARELMDGWRVDPNEVAEFQANWNGPTGMNDLIPMNDLVPDPIEQTILDAEQDIAVPADNLGELVNTIRETVLHPDGTPRIVGEDQPVADNFPIPVEVTPEMLNAPMERMAAVDTIETEYQEPERNGYPYEAHTHDHPLGAIV